MQTLSCKMTFLVIAMCLTMGAYPQTPADTVANKASVKKEQPVQVTSKPAAKAEPNKTTTQELPCEKCCDKELTSNQKRLVMMPVVFFVLLLFITILAAKRAGYNFSQAFYCDEPEDVVAPAPTATDPNATRKTTLLDMHGLPVYMPSTSKLIAFLSSLTTLVVIVCFVSYYAYCMMKCRDLPAFKDLFEVFVGLGLGIIPYGIKQLASAGKS